MTTHSKPMIPDHEMIRQIGRGSYGEVWLARNVMGQYRAVKVVYQDRFDSERPYEREFSGIKKFEPVSRRHESQLDLLHVGRNGDYFYYVMELADDVTNGQEIDPDHYAPRTLKHELQQRGRLPFAECLEIALSLATALKHLHGSGLVHRDVKPSNVIFINGRPKLADIGLVADIDATLSYVGTEGYLPPEGPGQATADIFSFGKVLYEISTGNDRKDFPEIPTSLLDSRELERLSELNEVIVKAGESNVQKRYQTADQILEDLLLLQSQKSVISRRKLEKRLRWFRRAAVLALVFGSLAWAGYRYHKHRIENAVALINKPAPIALMQGSEEREEIMRLEDALDASEQNAIDMAIALGPATYKLHDRNAGDAMESGQYQEAALWSQSAFDLADSEASRARQLERLNACLRQLPRLTDYYRSAQWGDLRGYAGDFANQRYYLRRSADSGVELCDTLDASWIKSSDVIRSSDFIRFWPWTDGRVIFSRKEMEQNSEIGFFKSSNNWEDLGYCELPVDDGWKVHDIGPGNARYLGVVLSNVKDTSRLRIGLFDLQSEKFLWVQKFDGGSDPIWRIRVSRNAKYVVATGIADIDPAPGVFKPKSQLIHLLDGESGALIDTQELDKGHELTRFAENEEWVYQPLEIVIDRTHVRGLRCWPISGSGFGQVFDIRSGRQDSFQNSKTFAVDIYGGPEPSHVVVQWSDFIELFDLDSRKSSKTLPAYGLITSSHLSPDKRKILAVVDHKVHAVHGLFTPPLPHPPPPYKSRILEVANGKKIHIHDLLQDDGWEEVFESKIGVRTARFAFPGDKIFVGGNGVRLININGSNDGAKPDDSFSAEELLGTLELLTGGIQMANGSFRQTDSKELTDLMNSLRESRSISRSGALDELIEWHIFELSSSMNATDANIPLFHVAELLKHQPNESRWTAIENDLTSRSGVEGEE